MQTIGALLEWQLSKKDKRGHDSKFEQVHAGDRTTPIDLVAHVMDDDGDGIRHVDTSTQRATM
eukprot:12919236-Prorocentrum_lima.AAC.1